MNKLNISKAFKIAMSDMNDDLALVWKPVADYIVDNTLQDLAVKFTNNVLEHDRPLYWNVDWKQPVSSTYLFTKEQKQLNKELGLTNTKTLNKFYKL